MQPLFDSAHPSATKSYSSFKSTSKSDMHVDASSSYLTSSSLNLISVPAILLTPPYERRDRTHPVARQWLCCSHFPRSVLRKLHCSSGFLWNAFLPPQDARRLPVLVTPYTFCLPYVNYAMPMWKFICENKDLSSTSGCSSTSSCREQSYFIMWRANHFHLLYETVLRNNVRVIILQIGKHPVSYNCLCHLTYCMFMSSLDMRKGPKEKKIIKKAYAAGRYIK